MPPSPRTAMHAARRRDVTVRRARASDAEAIASIYLSSFRTALPSVRLAHTDSQVRDWLRSIVVPDGGAPEDEAWVAVAKGGACVAMMVLTPAQLDQLYVDPAWQRRGLGGRLVKLAKRRRPGGLELYTFQVNAPARAFYERHGFRVVDMNDGSRNEEREPDIRYAWKRRAAPRSQKPGGGE